MSEWKDRSDEEINIAVNKIENQGGEIIYFINNDQESWPLINKNEITVIDYYVDIVACAKGFLARDKNELRAAMIVYLEMNGVKPNE